MSRSRDNVRQRLVEVFSTSIERDFVQQWLDTENDQFDNKTPVDYALESDENMHQVEGVAEQFLTGEPRG